MEKPMCKTCPYHEYDEHATGDHYCMRHAPSPIQNDEPGDTTFTHWPPIDIETDWCGEHPNFPAYLASLKPQPEDSGITLRQALESRGIHELSMRAINALENKKIVGGEDNPFLDRPLTSINEHELMKNLRNFGMTSALEFRRWRESIMAGQNGSIVSPEI